MFLGILWFWHYLRSSGASVFALILNVRQQDCFWVKCSHTGVFFFHSGNLVISELLCWSITRDSLLSLQKLYASIRSEPFKIPEDDGNDLTLTFFNPDREGWLLKLGETMMMEQIWVVCRRRVSADGFPSVFCVFCLLKAGKLKPGRGGGSSWPTAVCTTLNTPRWASVCLSASAKYGNVKHFSGGSKPKSVCDLHLLQDKDPIGIIPLEDLCVRELQDSSKPVDFYLLFVYQREWRRVERPRSHYLLPHESHGSCWMNFQHKWLSQRVTRGRQDKQSSVCTQ